MKDHQWKIIEQRITVNENYSRIAQTVSDGEAASVTIAGSNSFVVKQMISSLESGPEKSCLAVRIKATMMSPCYSRKLMPRCQTPERQS